MIGALVLAAVAIAAILFVAWPLLRPPSPAERLGELGERERRLLELRERRDAAYAALRELELERRTGKLTEDDYAASRAALRAEAIEALRELDELEPGDRAPRPKQADDVAPPAPVATPR